MKELKNAVLQAVLFCFLFCPLLLDGQSGIQYWNTDNGLSNNWVSDVLQDQDGYIWVATQYGLNRFDGYSFTNIKYKPNDVNSLQANWVKTMCLDQSGNIWLGTFFGGVSKMNPVSKEIERYKLNTSDPFSVTTVLDLFCGNDQKIWASCTDGLYSKSSEDSDFKKCYHGRVETIAPAKDDNLFFLSGGMVLHYNSEGATLDTILNTGNLPIQQIVSDGNDEFWAVNDQQLLRISHKNDNWTLESLLEKSNVKFNQFYRPLLTLDKEGNLWMGVQNGVIKFNTVSRDREFYKLSEFYPKSAKSGHILKLFYDQLGNQWVGTTEGLLLHAKYTKRFEIDRKYSDIESVQNVRELLQYKDMLFLGNAEGLFLFDLSNPDREKQKLLSTSVTSLFLNGSNELLVCGRSIQKIQLDNLSIGSIPALNHIRRIWSIVKDKSGKIWISTLQGLFRYDYLSNQLDHYTPKNVPSLVTNINQELCLDSNGHLWACSLASGSYMLEDPHLLNSGDTPTFNHLKHIEGDEQSLSSSILTSIVEDSDGFIWIGTDGGLNKVDPRNMKVRQYLNKDGLVDEKIMALILDNQGFVWGSTAGHGVFRLNTKTDDFSFFNHKDGLVNNNFLVSAAFKNKEGHLFFGSNENTQVIEPLKASSFSQPSTSFDFTTLQIADRDQSIILLNDDTGSIDLTYRQSSFNVQYATLNYFQASETEYYYRLKDVQDEWRSNNTSRSIAFNGLESGSYLLEVKAVNPDLHFDDTIIELMINISAPWWKAWWAKLGYALLFIGILYAIYRSRLNARMKRFESDRIKELDNLKKRFYVNITHELRTPLSVIIGEAQGLKDSLKKETKNKGAAIYRNGHQLLDLINQILDLSKLESGKLRVKLQHGDILPYISYLINSFQSLADKKNIRLHYLTSLPSLAMDYDTEKMKRIISNLLSNAIKYTPEGGDVYINVEEENNLAFISVKDTGVGISKEDLPFVFDRYFQSDDNRGGTGIGLALTNELILLLEGTIHIESELEKGSIFKIILPIEKNASVASVPQDPSIFQGLQTVDIDAERATHEYGQDNELPLIQVVEDHEDVRNFIISILLGDYRILESKDGAQGLENALEYIPDLVISDVMMPKMDGYELCNALKNHELTNHIPIILLTAKADFSSKIEGLEQGADAYLSKPFEPKEVRVRIRKLLELRLSLQNRYNNISADSQEKEFQDEFLLKAKSIIEQNLSDSDFGIAGLCSQLHISRVHLHRKLKALTGRSTSIFIRTIRLQKAHELLKLGHHNVSEVAYEVGFSDPSYFSRLYSEFYGVSPSVTNK